MPFLIAIIVGILCGTLVNYLADVLPWTRRISTPVCFKCGEKLSWRTYFSLSKCSSGHNRFIRWCLVWWFYLGLAAFLVFLPPAKLGFLSAMVLFSFLGLLGLIDIEHRVVLNETVIAGTLICLIYGIVLQGILKSLLGGVVGYGVMLALYGIGVIFSKWMSKKKGLPDDEVALGFGDVNLSGILGLAVGWPLVVLELISAILLAGIISGLIIVGMLIAKRYHPFQAIPYAPFLILASGVLIYLMK